jgi:hypothetical protein
MDTNQPDPDASADAKAPAPEIDQMKLQMLNQQIRDNQNLSLAVLGGSVAALVGAAVWAGVTFITSWQIGFMAVGIGFLVGYVVRRLGQGVDMSFGIAGAVLSLAGCVMGNYFTACALIADAEGIGIFEVLLALDMQMAIEIMIDTFQFMDLLFYGFAVYYGYKNSFRQMTDAELRSVARY